MNQDDSEDKIAGNIQNNRLYRLKKTGASADDIVNVWGYVSSYINSQMQKSKGVNIIGLGLFTFIHRKTDVGNNKYLLVERPVFVLSERFAQQHQISTTKQHLTGQIQTTDLNYSAVAYDSPYTRDLVEECVRDVINEFSRAISGGRNIEFSFATVGRLSIRNRKLKMRFYKEFINSLEGSEEIMNAMRDRPDTADSVMTRASSRAHSVNTMVLPSIGETKASKAPAMAAIDENVEISLDDVGNITDPELRKAIEQVELSGTNVFGDGTEEYPLIGCVDGQPSLGERYHSFGAQELDSMGLPAMLLEEAPNPATLEAKDLLRGGSRVLAPIAQAGGFSFDDMTPRSALKSYRPPSVVPGNMTRRSVGGSAPSPGMRRSATMPLELDSSRPAPLSPIGHHNQTDISAQHGQLEGDNSMGMAWPAQPRIETPTSDCGHNNAGQELCYLCHQRAARNIPVSFDEERKRREAEEDKVIHDFQIMKNNEFVLKEQEKNLARRHSLQKQAAFNLGVAEAISDKKNARAEKEAARAYIFQRRPLTPPRYLKQQQLQGYLTQQIDHRDGLHRKDRADREFLERLEQVQLAEDLAAQRDQFMKERYGEREKYKEALATQMLDTWRDRSKNDWWRKNKQTLYMLDRGLAITKPVHPLPSLINKYDAEEILSERMKDNPPFDFLLKYKPLQVPDMVSDNEVFGKKDTTQADLIARKEHARKIASEQLGSVADRKRAEILNRLQDQEDEDEKIRQSKAELLEDRAQRYERMTRNRRALENDWVKASEQKKGREIEERLRCITPGGLIHEQCDRYRRCAQCKKRTNNCGETNLWKESYYIPGARIMV